MWKICIYIMIKVANNFAPTVLERWFAILFYHNSAPDGAFIWNSHQLFDNRTIEQCNNKTI